MSVPLTLQLATASQNISINERLSTIQENLSYDYVGRRPLEMADLDLKVKLHHLESNTKRGISRMSDGSETFPSSGAQSAVFLHQIDQLSVELEQRNKLLLRAKNTIEALKTEVIRIRSEHLATTIDFEEQLKQSRNDNHELINRYHADVLALETRIAAAEDLVKQKEILKSEAEMKLVSVYHRRIRTSAVL
jgi:hypothetical protein